MVLNCQKMEDRSKYLEAFLRRKIFPNFYRLHLIDQYHLLDSKHPGAIY
jgi:hypothetical protein